MKRTKKDALQKVKEVKVGGLTYRIIRKQLKRCRDAIVMGQCDYNTRVIRVHSQLNNEECGFVLMHELLHACHDATSCDEVDYESEDFIHPFSRLLWDAMRNAGLIDKKWLKR
jgi:Zn-dependent peptidase ImmA (M78 family)